MKVKIILYLSLICCLTDTAIGASSLFDLQKIAKDNVKLTLQVAQLPKQRKSSLLTAVQLKINRLMPEYWQALIENAETSKQQNQTRKLLRTQRVERVTRKLTGLYIIYQALALSIKAHNTPAILSPVDACFLRALIRSEENRQVYGSLPETACTSSPAEIDQPQKPSTASIDITKSPKLPLYSGIAFWGRTVKSKNSTRVKNKSLNQNDNNETFSTPEDFIKKQSTTTDFSTFSPLSLKRESITATIPQQPERPKSPLNLFGHHGNNSTSNNFDFDNYSSDRGPVDFSAGQTQESW